jgi:hypothetical protein
VEKTERLLLFEQLSRPQFLQEVCDRKVELFKEAVNALGPAIPVKVNLFSMGKKSCF